MIKYTYIYSLIDPRNGDIRYIGKTNNTKLRLSNHLVEKHKTYKVNWIKSLKKINLKPILEILDKVLIEDWQFWEQHYISLYKSWGFKLTNSTNGGDGNKSVNLVKLRKRICKYDFNKTLIECYGSLTEASLKNNVKMSHLSSCCRGNINTLNGFIWRYENDSIDKYNFENKKARKIYQKDLNGNLICEYKSISNACKALKCKPSSISRVLCKKRKKFRKFIFEYKDIV